VIKKSILKLLNQLIRKKMRLKMPRNKLPKAKPHQSLQQLVLDQRFHLHPQPESQLQQELKCHLHPQLESQLQQVQKYRLHHLQLPRRQPHHHLHQQKRNEYKMLTVNDKLIVSELSYIVNEHFYFFHF
jgi:hypothetical protein